jgi:peroxiredoxin Q/BCP
MPTAQKKTVAKKPVKSKAKPVAKPKQVASDGVGVGDKAPAFSLAATKIGKAASAALKGKPYVLYFYPKDDTSGCTAEACDFRDGLPNFSKLGATIIGVSKDSIESHEKFAKKYNLNFPLASDPDCRLCEAYGVWKEKSMYGRKYMGVERSTFVVDGKGVIRAAWRKVSVPGHADEVKKALAEI